ncbi:MAG: 50S ribosomal protein L15 [Chloroflexi bacterium]|nr:50S ribosomal protein L15 [Chloroflexota bacterium]
MKEHELRPPEGSVHRRKRVGRGHGSGHVKTAGRGTKGQKSRSGGNIRPGFQGGQTPIAQQLPFKRGFTNIFKVYYETINLARLSEFSAGATVTPEALTEAGVIRSLKKPVKILGLGELDRALHVKAHKFSETAKKKIEAAGGTVEEIS